MLMGCRKLWYLKSAVTFTMIIFPKRPSDSDDVSEPTKRWFDHSHKKRKDSLEGSLDRVLFAAELKFPKILVLKLPQHTSDVNIKCSGKSV